VILVGDGQNAGCREAKIRQTKEIGKPAESRPGKCPAAAVVKALE
jgi:hypothetical protein